MLISLAAINYDPQGAGIVRVAAESAQAMQSGQRRQTKTATLDGGSVLYDTGHTLSDMTWKLKISASPANTTLINYLCREYSEFDLRFLNRHVRASIQTWETSGAYLSVNISVLQEM